jgi:hypothetical protein
MDAPVYRLSEAGGVARAVGVGHRRELVDATNRLASFHPFRLGDISGRTSSEIVADLDHSGPSLPESPDG